MGEPEEGLAKYFENTEALADVFSLFSDKDILKIIFFMYSRQNFPVALSVIASKTGIGETKAEALMGTSENRVKKEKSGLKLATSGKEEKYVKIECH